MKGKTKTKDQRRKMFVAFLICGGAPTVAGISTGFTDAEARRLFASERGVPVSAVAVTWTGHKDVSFETYCIACDAQADFLARGGDG
jgi:hypothetical protein